MELWSRAENKGTPDLLRGKVHTARSTLTLTLYVCFENAASEKPNAMWEQKEHSWWGEMVMSNKVCGLVDSVDQSSFLSSEKYGNRQGINIRNRAITILGKLLWGNGVGEGECVEMRSHFVSQVDL